MDDEKRQDYALAPSPWELPPPFAALTEGVNIGIPGAQKGRR
jgi:hypothetical protein